MDTPILSDIKVLDNLLALNLNVSLWSARKKMVLEDFGGAELPPEDLASLGSKRIADPNSLKVFVHSESPCLQLSGPPRHPVHVRLGHPGRQGRRDHQGTHRHP